MASSENPTVATPSPASPRSVIVSVNEPAASTVQNVDHPSETAAVASTALAESDVPGVTSAADKVIVPATPVSDSGQEASHNPSAGDVVVPLVALNVPLEAMEDGPPTPTDTTSGMKRGRTASKKSTEKKSGPGRGRKKMKRTLSPSSMKDQEESSRPSRAARVEKKVTEQETKAAKEAEREAAGNEHTSPLVDIQFSRVFSLFSSLAIFS